MTDLLNFIPVRIETVAAVRARLQADVNAGKDPAADTYYDADEGSVLGDMFQATALEFERLWDVAATDVVATAFPSTAWGNYLDEHGVTLGVPRKGAVTATGELTFTGENGTQIGIGTEVSTESASPEDDGVVVKTTESGVITGGTLTLAAEAAEAGADGNIATDSATQLLSPVEADEDPDVTNAAAFSGGAEVETDEAYSDRLLKESSATQGGGSIADYERWALGYPGVGHVRVVPLWLGPGSVRVIVTDAENNPLPTSVVAALQGYLDPNSAATTLTAESTLPDAVIDVTDTTGFAEAGKVVIGDNLITYTGRTGTTFTGCTGGTGTVPIGTPVYQRAQGLGQAPVGHVVSVATAEILAITVAADITYDDGYTLDGAGGTIGLEADIQQAIRDYIDELPPGGEDPPGLESPPGAGFVLLNRVTASFFSVEGVYDVASVTLNAAGTDLAVAPLEVPETTTFTLT